MKRLAWALLPNLISNERNEFCVNVPWEGSAGTENTMKWIQQLKIHPLPTKKQRSNVFQVLVGFDSQRRMEEELSVWSMEGRATCWCDVCVMFSRLFLSFRYIYIYVLLWEHLEIQIHTMNVCVCRQGKRCHLSKGVFVWSSCVSFWSWLIRYNGFLTWTSSNPDIQFPPNALGRNFKRTTRQISRNTHNVNDVKTSAYT